MYDYVFSNALIVDGTGRDEYRADVAVYSSLICLIEKPYSLSARHVIDKPDLVLSPGFIDIHSHDDLEVLRNPSLLAKLAQGITLDINGNCGIGLFPMPKDKKDLITLSEDILGLYDGPFSWSDYSSYVEMIEKNGTGINLGFLTAHSALRLAVLGSDYARAAGDKEIEEMCSLLDKQLKEGSLGFSTGLYYSPCMFADKRELLSLLSVVKRNDKLFSVHHRCEGDDIIESVSEVLNLASESGVRLEISHL